MRRSHTKLVAAWAGSSLLLALVAACGPVPTPAPVIAPPPVAAVEAPTAEIDWRDLALSPGRWTYVPSTGDTVAQFAKPGAAPDFAIRCNRKTRALVLFRAGGSAGPMTITTSYSGLSFPVQTAGDGISITLPATSDFLDRIAFSRGHVAIAAPGLPMLVLPAWAEPARVIQDCRA